MKYAAVESHYGDDYVAEVDNNLDIEFIEEVCDACFDRDHVIGLFDTEEEAEQYLR